MIFCIISDCIVRIQTNCGIAISGNRRTKMCSEGWRTRKEKGTKKDRGCERIRCGRENEREWHLHWLTAKSHLIKMSERRLETSQGNTVWMSSLEELSLRDSAWVTRETVLIFFDVAIVEREVMRQMGDKYGSHCSSSRNAQYSDHHNSGSAVLSLIPIKLMNDCGQFEGKHLPAVNHEDKSGYQQTANGFLLCTMLGKSDYFRDASLREKGFG